MYDLLHCIGHVSNTRITLTPAYGLTIVEQLRFKNNVRLLYNSTTKEKSVQLVYFSLRHRLCLLLSCEIMMQLLEFQVIPQRRLTAKQCNLVKSLRFPQQ